MNLRLFLLCWLLSAAFTPLFGQNDYFFPQEGAFNSNISSPESFLGYAIGSHHTRHDRIISYLEYLAANSDRASLEVTGETYEHRKLVIFTVSSVENQNRMKSIRQAQLERCNPDSREMHADMPIVINLGYNVHGNEPSSSEAAMLMAYYLVANESEQAKKFRQESVVHFDPCINPDGRDRHSHWANMHKGNPLVSDPIDREHTEIWPSGRTNHYWFDLNRDWLLAVHPESKAKLKWFHTWYPNVVTDFHEMGTNSTYFFEPMKTNGSKDPIMPKDNYIKLNDIFARYYQEGLDKIGSQYFTKEVFDGTYPGYGSSYPDLQGGLALLFEQASSRGHLQRKDDGTFLTFAFTIRNQLTSSIATVKAAVENKDILFPYQKDFFKSAISNAKKDKVKAYVFGDPHDANRNRAFIDLLLRHEIDCYPINKDLKTERGTYTAGNAWLVPTEQVQYRMVQTMFEAYTTFHDSVFYDASAWSTAHFYNMPFEGLGSFNQSSQEKVSFESNRVTLDSFEESSYGYLVSWEDYYAPKFLQALLDAGVRVRVATRTFSNEERNFDYGTLFIPTVGQELNSSELYNTLKQLSTDVSVPVHTARTGFSTAGIDLGSRWIAPVQSPKVLMIIGQGVSAYEAGEVWHLLDTKVNLPVTKVDISNFGRARLDDYTTMVMVSGNYGQLDDKTIARIKNWVQSGGTLITQRSATQWAIKNGLAKEVIIEPEGAKANEGKRLPYVQAREISGARAIGGTIFEAELDLSHPLAFGYSQQKIPVYRNSNIIVKPSKNPYSTVAQYTDDPLISGFVSKPNLDLLKSSASLLVSPAGRGRMIMFVDNPNFRGSWFGTNKLFLNAIYFGNLVRIP